MKKIISVILCICIMLTVVAMSASAAPSSNQISKGVLLYVGYNAYSTTTKSKYYKPTDDELKKLLEVTDEIVLIPIVTYNRYTDANGQEKQVMSQDVIDNMTEDMVAVPSLLDEIKATYTEIAKLRIEANYHVNDYIEDATELGNRLVALNPDVRLWYSVPSAESLSPFAHLFVDAWNSIVDGVKEKVGEEIWNKNVQGFYYSTEDIITGIYAKFNPDNPEGDFDCPVVYAMRQVSEKVHSYNKNFMWIPYGHVSYGTGGPMVESYRNLGYVVNLTNIFDTVVIQPSYYFHEDRIAAMDVIKNSVEQQAVLDADGNIIGGKKTSDTVIGWEMEIDSNYSTNNDYVTRYNSYVDTFEQFLGEYPTVYYADRPEIMLTLTDEIGEFFSGGSGSSSSSSSTPSSTSSSSSSTSTSPSTSSAAPSESGDSSADSSTVSPSASEPSISSSSTVPQVKTGDAAFPLIAALALAVVAGASVAISRKRR